MNKMRVPRIVTAALLACLSVAYGGEHPDGISQVSRAQDAVGNYHFSYKVSNAEGEQFRQEGTDAHGRVVGSYGLTHSDGTGRVVDYVADKGGFRAQIRTNEPGVAEADSADASVQRTDNSGLLYVAANSQGSGNRVKTVQEYRPESRRLGSESDEQPLQLEAKPSVDEEESRRDFDDYRPLNPVAYYPASVGTSARRPIDVHRLLPKDPEGSRSLDVYFPPIDPNRSIMRRPNFQKDEGEFYPTTTSRRPFVPPYGGFDDDPQPELGPGVTMSTIHGGLGNRYPPPLPHTPFRGMGPSPGVFPIGVPGRSEFGNSPRYPLGTGLPTLGRSPDGSVGPLGHSPDGSLGPLGRSPGGSLGPLVRSPGTSLGSQGRPLPSPGAVGMPQFILRAVPIPNGIQAVRVDPNSGRVYERLVYPLFLRQDGHPAYDRNILLHNDDFDDEDRDNNREFSEFPYRPYRDQNEESPRRRRNSTLTIDDRHLSEPSSEDMDWIQKQIALIEGFDRVSPNSVSDPEFPDVYGEGNPEYGRGGRILSSPQFDDSEDSFSRVPRHSDRLIDGDSKEITSELDESPSKISQIEKEGSSSKIEKE